ncbi:hypothetical protein PanWU01x14_303750 [Parasponia andersonii]|uniref:Uncharacterized protein n=1 Tax=Parasponia andersonii TaxID=3476 RepID=A0A2P5AST3_PARAD|nr:hypothetical protein PanWU01x14_303750 [Parasponia andersonii]
MSYAFDRVKRIMPPCRSKGASIQGPRDIKKDLAKNTVSINACGTPLSWQEEIITRHQCNSLEAI